MKQLFLFATLILGCCFGYLSAFLFILHAVNPSILFIAALKPQPDRRFFRLHRFLRKPSRFPTWP